MSEPKPDIVTGERSRCINCKQKICAVIDPYSGVVDWGSDLDHALGVPAGLDFGCEQSPDTSKDGTGSHNPGPGHTPCGFRTRTIVVPLEVEILDHDLMRGIASGLCPGAKGDDERAARIAAAMGCNPALNGLQVKGL